MRRTLRLSRLLLVLLVFVVVPAPSEAKRMSILPTQPPLQRETTTNAGPKRLADLWRDRPRRHVADGRRKEVSTTAPWWYRPSPDVMLRYPQFTSTHSIVAAVTTLLLLVVTGVTWRIWRHRQATRSSSSVKTIQAKQSDANFAAEERTAEPASDAKATPADPIDKSDHACDPADDVGNQEADAALKKDLGSTPVKVLPERTTNKLPGKSNSENDEEEDDDDVEEVEDPELRELLAGIDEEEEDEIIPGEFDDKEEDETFRTRGHTKELIPSHQERSTDELKHVPAVASAADQKEVSASPKVKRVTSRVRERYRQALAGQSRSSPPPPQANFWPTALVQTLETLASTAAVHTTTTTSNTVATTYSRGPQGTSAPMVRDWVAQPASHPDQEPRNPNAHQRSLPADSHTLKANEELAISPLLLAGQQLWSQVRQGAARLPPELSSSSSPWTSTTRQTSSSAPQTNRRPPLTDRERARLFAASVLEESDDYEKKRNMGGAATRMNQWFGAWSSS
jgi:hypothetical protein